MERLVTPDFCARLDRLKFLCDELERAQDDREKYRKLILQIRAETEALQDTVCQVTADAPGDRRPQK